MASFATLNWWSNYGTWPYDYDFVEYTTGDAFPYANTVIERATLGSYLQYLWSKSTSYIYTKDIITLTFPDKVLKSVKLYISGDSAYDKIISDGTELSFTELADNGLNVTVTTNTVTFTITDTKKYQAYSSFTNSAYNVVPVYIIAEFDEVKTYNYTQNLTNCSSDYTDSIIDDTEHTITLTANEYYQFDNTPTYTMSDTNYNFTLSTDKQTATAIITPTNDIIVNATANLIQYNVTQNLTNCISDYTATTLTAGESCTITLTADTNYNFTSKQPTYTIGDTSYNFTISSDAKTATATMTATGDIVITATAVKASYYLVLNLSNCTCNYSESDRFTAGETYTITLTANDDYYFNEVPTITISDVTSEFTLNDDKTIATFEYLASGNGTIKAETKSSLASVTLTLQDDYASTDFVNGSYKIGSTVTMIINFITDGWFYGNLRFFDNDGGDIQDTLNPTITPSTDYKSVTVSYVVPDSVTRVTCASYAGIRIVYSQLTNCTTDTQEGYYRQGETYTVTLTANDEYKFNQEFVPTLTVSTLTEEVATFDFGYSDKKATFTFTASGSWLGITQYSKISTLTIDASAVGESGIEENYTFIHAYCPTNDELYELSGVRYGTYTTTTTGDYSTTTTETTYDYGQFILKLYKTFIPVSTSKTDSIRLAYYDTQVNAPLIDNAIVKLDCGTFKIDEIQGNNIDYEDTQAFIFLPYVGVFELDIEQVMNHEITLKYTCNILDASCYVTIANETGIFAQYTGTIKEEIPYTIMYNEKVVQEYVCDSLITSEQVPFIKLVQNKPLNESGIGQFGTNSDITDVIGNFKGYNAFNAIELVTNTNMLYDEALMIKQALQEGVFLDD